MRPFAVDNGKLIVQTMQTKSLWNQQINKSLKKHQCINEKLKVSKTTYQISYKIIRFPNLFTVANLPLIIIVNQVDKSISVLNDWKLTFASPHIG